MSITYMINFLDKGVLSNASVFGLIPDLVSNPLEFPYRDIVRLIRSSQHLVGSQYSWVGSVFYFGYAASFGVN